jgi:hypothetical protein
MQTRGSANAQFALFTLLALGSLSLKAAAGPPRDRVINSEPQRFERSVQRILSAQQFGTSLRAYPYRSTLVLAQRGECRLAVRDATFGAALAPAFADDARDVGPIRYLYGGKSYEQPPGMIVRWGRLKFEILDRLGLKRPIPVMIALAESPKCGSAQFGLSDLKIET